MRSLEAFLGSGAGLSAATITRLSAQWHDNIRLEEKKLCLLVMIGFRVDGTKELISLTEGYRESAGSWADLLRDCQRRGMRAPVLAVNAAACAHLSLPLVTGR